MKIDSILWMDELQIALGAISLMLNNQIQIETCMLHMNEQLNFPTFFVQSSSDKKLQRALFVLLKKCAGKKFSFCKTFQKKKKKIQINFKLYGKSVNLIIHSYTIRSSCMMMTLSNGARQPFGLKTPIMQSMEPFLLLCHYVK